MVPRFAEVLVTRVIFAFGYVEWNELVGSGEIDGVVDCDWALWKRLSMESDCVERFGMERHACEVGVQLNR
jgi:hypothetical protein